MEVTEIGLKSDDELTFLTLGMGVIIAVLHAAGTVDVDRVKFS